MYKILVIEDDIEISDVISLHIEDDQKKVIKAYDGEEGLKAFNNNDIDLIIVDIMMPLKDGYTVIKEIRQTSNVPIIVLSAKNLNEDKILGLNLGADDYIEKPFNGLELSARVNAQLRRFNKLGSNSLSESIVTFKEIKLYPDEIKVTKNNEDIPLTTIEFKILKLLISNPGRVYTKTQIYETIMGEYFESDDNTIMVHISNLRAKIEDNPRRPKYIKNIRGLGYKIEK